MTHTNQFTTQPFAPKQWEKTEDGFLRVKARVLAERVMPYSPLDFTCGLPDELANEPVINMLVDRTSMTTGDSLRTLESAQVTAPAHVWVTPDNDHDSKGNAVGSPRLDGPYLEIDLLVTDPDAIQDIEAGRIGEISAGYHADTIFEPGEFDGTPFHARQVALRFNHIAVIPYGTGRAGSDVRIINQKQEGDTNMADQKIVRVQLRNTKRFVNVDEEGAQAIAAEEAAATEAANLDGKKLEDLMKEAEEAKASAADANAQLEELRGELSVYKEKLDELLSTEAIEHAAMGMVAEQAEANEIIENAIVCNEKGEEDEKEKEKVFNSIKSLHGTKLHTTVLNSIGVKTEGMSAEAIRGAFKAQHQIMNTFKDKKHVAGHRMMNMKDGQPPAPPQQRTAKERLGFKK